MSVNSCTIVPPWEVAFSLALLERVSVWLGMPVGEGEGESRAEEGEGKGEVGEE